MQFFFLTMTSLNQQAWTNIKITIFYAYENNDNYMHKSKILLKSERRSRSHINHKRFSEIFYLWSIGRLL